MSVEQQEQRIIDNAIATRIDFLNSVPGELEGQAACIPIAPVLLSHFLTIRAKPGQIFHLRAADAPPLKEFTSSQHRMLMKKSD
jgi:hypothetical protein